MNERDAKPLNNNIQIAGNGAGWTAIYAGDSALILQFGDAIDRTIVDKVNHLDTLIHTAIVAGALAGVTETVPTFRSLAIIYDPCTVHPRELIEQIRAIESVPADGIKQPQQPPRHWELPVLYGSDEGPDLENVAQLTGLTQSQVIDLHASCTFTVYMLGFLPGYAFLGDTPAELYLPRRSEPRLRVPEGSVAIAMQLTGIYPWESPGGWHILGNCPVPMFNAKQSPPALLKAGDKVTFRKINRQTFEQLKNERDRSLPDNSRWDISSQ